MTRLAALLAVALAGVAAAEGGELVHGADSTFAARGVAVLWAVLRGADETSTTVVLRVVSLDRAHGALAAEGVDPFSGRRVAVSPPAALETRRELRIPRGWFAEYPRTEIHLARGVEELRARRPALTIYFTGVPDTTPELTSEGALAAYFEAALARARGR